MTKAKTSYIPYRWQPNICQFASRCKYGSGVQLKYCDYIGKTGRSRVNAGYKIYNGRCDAFEPRKGKE